MMKFRKAQLGNLAPAAIAFVFIAIVLGVGADVLTDIRADYIPGTWGCGANSTGGTDGTLLYTNCSTAYNATTNGLAANDTLAGWLPTIGLVVAAAIIIGVLALFRA